MTAREIPALHERLALSLARRTGVPVGPLLRAVRPRQFSKNVLLFLALVFTVRLYWRPADPGTWLPLLLRSVLAFIAFCFVAAAEYLVNDVCDLQRDRLHPRKRLRPIAAGELAPRTAQQAAVVLLVAGFACGLPLGWRFSAALLAYAALTLAYSYALKRLIFVDVLAIALGFVLRAAAGALAIGVPISAWLYAVTLLGALLLAVNKRRNELQLVRGGAEHAMRPTLARYSTRLLDRLAAMIATATVITYAAYTLTAKNLPQSHAMIATLPFVVYGVARYQYLVYRRDEGRAPDELILRDRPLLVCVALWTLAAGVILAIGR